MSKSDQTKLINEIKILSELDHPNIVKMYEYFDSKKQFYIVTETCEGGELFDEIISWGKFNELDAAMVMSQLLSSVNYCHQNKVIHRDLKPENILLDSSKQLDKLKVIDFGISLV